MRDNKPDERSGTSSLQLLSPSANDRSASRRKGSITSFASSHDGHSSIDGTEADHPAPDVFNLSAIRRPKSDATSLTIASHTHPDSDTSKLHDRLLDDIPPPSTHIHRDTHSEARPPNPGAFHHATPDLGPFSLDPSQLASLLDPKDLDALQALGGVASVLDGLGTHHTSGLLLDVPDRGGGRPSHDILGAAEGAPKRHHPHVPKSPPAAPDDSQSRSSSTAADSNVRRTHDAHTASLADRKAVYGENILPQRPTTSLLGLMWLALKDKVLVRQRSIFISPIPSHSTFRSYYA